MSLKVDLCLKLCSHASREEAGGPFWERSEPQQSGSGRGDEEDAVLAIARWGPLLAGGPGFAGFGEGG